MKIDSVVLSFSPRISQSCPLCIEVMNKVSSAVLFLMASSLVNKVVGFSRIYLTTTRVFTARRSVAHLHNPLGSLSSSYEVDTDGYSEQHLADAVIQQAALNGDTHAINRYKDVLDSVGLRHKLKSVTTLPPLRQLSNNDVFCNRELKLSGIRAIGFDMDYTLAQYKQPDFDRLAFDGAKEKLVGKLGYPKEAMDFMYDHTKWTRGLIIDTQVSAAQLVFSDTKKTIPLSRQSIQFLNTLLTSLFLPFDREETSLKLIATNMSVLPTMDLTPSPLKCESSCTPEHLTKY